jgi:menaquinone-specific isochorismate synthase
MAQRSDPEGGKVTLTDSVWKFMDEFTDIFNKEAIIESLAARIDSESFAVGDYAGSLCRFEAQVNETDILGWLGRQNKIGRIYFCNREKTFTAAGLSEADSIDNSQMSLEDALDLIDGDLKGEYPGIRYYGGICFDDSSEQWNGFGQFRFTVPEFELTCENEKNVFAYTTMCRQDDTKQSLKDKLTTAVEKVVFDKIEKSNFHHQVSDRRNNPEKDVWLNDATEVIRRITAGKAEKVVLSRKVTIEIKEQVDPISLLAAVSENNVNTYEFVFAPADAAAFIGTSPECLYRRDEENIYSEAVAGTCPAGENDSQAEEYRDRMRQNEKETAEHEFVFADVKAGLDEICTESEAVNARQILLLKHVQHFHSRFEGVLNDEVGTSQIITAFHPTSAVCGYPKDASLDIITEGESFSRGWYAGPVGWIGKESSEFAVGIRSGVVDGNQVDLFAGAGLVDASEPEKEWEETENKLRQFLEVIEQNQLSGKTK